MSRFGLSINCGGVGVSFVNFGVKYVENLLSQARIYSRGFRSEFFGIILLYGDMNILLFGFILWKFTVGNSKVGKAAFFIMFENNIIFKAISSNVGLQCSELGIL